MKKLENKVAVITGGTSLPPNDPAFHGKINVARPENNYIKTNK
jgi:hypothetical protein